MTLFNIPDPIDKSIPRFDVPNLDETTACEGCGFPAGSQDCINAHINIYDEVEKEKQMEVIYAGQPFCPSTKKKSIFLAGPTPRSPNVKSWRPEALAILGSYDIYYEGIVLVPETPDGKFPDYAAQIEWEHYCLDNCSKIVFWVPRNIENMLAMTTNIEFGTYMKSKRIVYGRPDGSPHTHYMDYCYKKFTGDDPFNDLEKMFEATNCKLINDAENKKFYEICYG